MHGIKAMALHPHPTAAVIPVASHFSDKHYFVALVSRNPKLKLQHAYITS
jgi:hypothetical protein